MADSSDCSADDARACALPERFVRRSSKPRARSIRSNRRPWRIRTASVRIPLRTPATLMRASAAPCYDEPFPGRWQGEAHHCRALAGRAPAP